MRNLKKFLALVLAMIMVVSAGAAVSAFTDIDDSQYADAINKLAEYGIVNGTDEGVFSPDDGVERFQMAIMMARALKPNETNWNDGMAIFDDVDEWYGAIAYAYINNIVNGVCEDPMLFAPHDPITYAQALTMAVRALGYTVANGNPWWLPAYTKATELGLTANMASSIKADDALTRAECAQIIANMLAAKPADGGATIEAKNFGVATVDNTTTFVITATPKQAYVSSDKIAENGFVALQKLENGVPSGDYLVKKISDLKITADEAESYFGYAINLINYDEKTGNFDDAKIVSGVKVAYNADLTDKGDAKFKFDGVTYYTAEQTTGDAVKNEIVIFDGSTTTRSTKLLLTNKDGDVVMYDKDNKEVVKANLRSETNGVKYYWDVEKNALISESVATERYGVEVSDSSAVDYNTIAAKELKTGNYQITFFDDNLDGRYDRAVKTDVYLSAFKAKNNDGETFGPMNKTKDVKYVDAETGETVNLTKGQVFSYTYNAALKTVSVLDIYDEQIGTITKINTTKNNSDNKFSVIVTIDGTEYTLANSVQETAGLTGATIANKESAAYDKIKDDAKLNYLYDNKDEYAKLVLGPVKFIAVGNRIIHAKSYSIDATFETVVLKELTGIGNGEIYADIYRNGILVKDVVITKIDGKNLSELSYIRFASLVADKDLFAAGNVFRAVVLKDGTYQLSEALDNKDADSLKAFKLSEFKTSTKPTIFFEDGIADQKIENGKKVALSAREDIVRTSDSTVFYFINSKGNVTTYVGMPDNSTIDLAKCTVYLDKIGYADDKTEGTAAGKASVVFVYYGTYTPKEVLSGFGVENVENATIYLFGSGAVTASEYASASYFGFTSSEYEGKNLYKYSVNAIDMSNGTKLSTIYAEGSITNGEFYKVAGDGVITGVATDVKTLENVTATNTFVQNRYYVIKGLNDSNAKIDTVILAKDKDNIKADKISDILGNDTWTVYYIEDFADGSFVGVALKKDAPKPTDPTEKGIANAVFKYGDDAQSVAIYDAKADTVTLYDQSGKLGDKVTGTQSSGNADKDSDYDVIAIKRVGASYSESNAVDGLKVNATYENGVLTVKGFTDADGNSFDLDKGTYKVEITFTINDVDCAVTYYTTID